MDTLSPNSVLEKQLVFAAERTNTPVSGAFELLPLCNLNCRMCYMRGSAAACGTMASVLPMRFWLKIAEELRQAGTIFLLLTGGEPFLYPEFKALYRELRSRGFILTLNTNGTMITPEIAAFLGENLPRRVNVTLYGASAETYRRVTGSESAFERTLDGIRNLLAAGVPVKMNVSLIPENADELEELYRIGAELGIPLEVNTYMYPATREPDEVYDESVRVSPEQAARLALQNERLLYGEEICEQRLAAMAEAYSNRNTVYSCSREMIPCRAGSSSFWINWRGELTPCVFLNQGKQNLKQVSFTEGWEQLSVFRRSLSMPEKCSACAMRRFCPVCVAAGFHENRALELPPEYLCRMTEEKLRLACELVNGGAAENG